MIWRLENDLAQAAGKIREDCQEHKIKSVYGQMEWPFTTPGKGLNMTAKE